MFLQDSAASRDDGVRDLGAADIDRKERPDVLRQVQYAASASSIRKRLPTSSRTAVRTSGDESRSWRNC